MPAYTCMLFSPKGKLATGNEEVVILIRTSICPIIRTDGAPGSVVVHLQTTFGLRGAADKSQVYNKYCH